MSSLEFSEWEQFGKLEPFGDTVRMAALIAFAIIRCEGNKTITLEDVMGWGGHRPADEPEPSADELRLKTKAVMGSIGEQIKKAQKRRKK